MNVGKPVGKLETMKSTESDVCYLLQFITVYFA